MTADTITAIKKALEGVTPGPWKAVSDAHFDNGLVYTSVQPVNVDEEAMKPMAMANGEYHVCRMSHTAAPWRFSYHRRNAQYIAAVNPEAISELLSTLESLQRENEALKKDRYDLAYAITGGEDAPGLLDSVPTSQLVDIAGNTHRSHSADIERAMAAEAEVKRLREKLEPFSRFAGVLFERNFNRADSVSGMDDVDGVLHTISAGPFFDARAALSSTEDSHGN